MSAIHVVNAADPAYVPHTAAMLHSLFTANPGESFAIHFLHREGFPREPLDRLAALCARHGAGFHPQAVPASRTAGLPAVGHFTEEAWYRLCLPQLLPDLDRVIWLDADVLVLAPIHELWSLDLQGLPLAACPNAVLYSFTDVVKALGITDRRRYFNTGVLLLDLRRLREEDSEHALREAIERHRPWIRFADQDALNAVYHSRYRRLPLWWNVLAHAHVNVPESIRVHGREEYRAAMAAPRIVHFTGPAPMKPWNYGCSHPARDLYLQHRAAAGWPPPAYADRTPKSRLLRRLPLRPRWILSRALRGRFAEALSCVRPW